MAVAMKEILAHNDAMIHELRITGGGGKEVGYKRHMENGTQRTLLYNAQPELGGSAIAVDVSTSCVA